ncbi:MAG: type II secretion system F family protein [Lachnospiraceae bacterium]|nr:type II secretion system F family protein [Lachnospiraceae bacterium]
MTGKRTLNTPFSNSEISGFCEQIALILTSGISSVEGISIMLEDAQSAQDKEILQLIYDKLLESGSFHEALESTGLFPSYLLKMTELAERTGTLDEVMVHLASHYARENSIAKSIRSAVTYPLVMATMMVVVILVLLVEVMPIFNQVFIQLGTEMTGFSRLLMDIGNVIHRYSAVLTVLLVVILAFFFIAARTPGGRKLLQQLGYRIPSLRRVYTNTAACRFASGMALTLSSGLDTQQSLYLAGELNEDPLFQSKMKICYQKMEEGSDLYEAIHAAGIFSGVYTRMASLGARTGNMDKVMESIASLYQEEVDDRINRLLATLEPALVIALSLIVGVILLSVMLPLMGIMSSI